MSSARSVCVFMGSNNGQGEEYLNAAKKLGKKLSSEKITLIYGGGRLGLMGVLADEILKNGGTVIGVITKDLLEREGHNGLTKLYVVGTMQERKLLMAQLSDACIAMPGGLGTLEEIFEFWNAYKLGLYKKPIGLLNVNNFFEKLIEFLKHCIQQEFVTNNQLQSVLVESDPSELVDRILSEKSCVNMIINENKNSIRLFLKPI